MATFSIFMKHFEVRALNKCSEYWKNDRELTLQSFLMCVCVGDGFLFIR